MSYNDTNAVDVGRKIRTQYVGCSGCKQTMVKSTKDLQEAARAADDRLKLANREHTYQMQKLKLETGKIVKSLQAKIRAFDKNVKEINVKGQKLAKGTFVHQECCSRCSSTLNCETSRKKSIAQAKEKEEPKHNEEKKNEDDEHELTLLNCRVSRTESELSVKIDEWEDLSKRLQKLEERNDILLETKHEHQDLVEKLECKCSEVELLNKRLLKTEINLSAQKDELTSKTELLECQRNIVEKQERLLESKEEQIRNLEKKLGDSEKRIIEAWGKIGEQGQEIDNKMVKLSELNQRIEKAEAVAQEAEGLFEKLIFLEHQNQILQQSKKDFENIILKHQGWFESRDAQLHNLENQLQERDDMLVEASRKIDEQRQKLESNRAELSGNDERRAKAEATAEELMQTTLLTFDSNVITAEYPERKRTMRKSALLKDGHEIRNKPSPSSSGLTIDISKEDTVSDMSELGKKSRPANSDVEESDLEESESEPSVIFGDADFSPEIKSEEPYPLGKKEYSPLTPDSSSVFNFGSTILSSADPQSTHNNFSLTEGPGKEKKGCSSTCSIDEQSRKIRSYFSPLNFSQDESFSQSKVTCIKMLSSDASLSGSFKSSMLDPLNSQKTEKNIEMKSQETHKDQEFLRKSGDATETWFQLNARVATLEEELRGKDNLLKKQSQELKEHAVKLAKYKSICKSTIKTPKRSAHTDVGAIDVMSIQEEILKNRVQKLEEELNRRKEWIISEKDKILSLENKYEERSQVIVKLSNKVGELQKRLVVREDLITTRPKREAENILRAVAIMENGLNNLFDCFKIYCLDLGNMVEELQKRTVDLKYYVAESSSEGFFQQYSLKSIPIKNCITSISKKFLKHQEEMYNFNQNFKNAVSVIRRSYKRVETSGQARSSSESKSSRVLSSSLHYHLQQSSLSSTEIPGRKCRSSSSLCQKKPSYSRRKRMVEDGPEDIAYEKSVADIETSNSAKSSIFAVFTSSSERARKVKKRYKLKKHFGRKTSGSKDRISHPEKICSVGQVGLTPMTRVATTKFTDENARVFKTKNSHKKVRYTKRNRKQVIPRVARPRRRRHKVKTLKQLKQSRTNTSRNALLEGLGYSTSPSK